MNRKFEMEPPDKAKGVVTPGNKEEGTTKDDCATALDEAKLEPGSETGSPRVQTRGDKEEPGQSY